MMYFPVEAILIQRWNQCPNENVVEDESFTDEVQQGSDWASETLLVGKDVNERLGSSE
jgi:hypothetical protein